MAEAAGVSRGLVSLALKGEGRMSQSTRQRILDAARQLRYRPHAAASELASRRSRRLAVVLPYLDNPFFDPLLRALRASASARGFLLAAFVSDLDRDIERSTIDDVLSLRPEGLILPGSSMSDAELADLSAQLPLVVMDRQLSPALGQDISVVRLDEAQAATEVVAHLRAQGVRRVVYLAPATHLYETLVRQRRAACRAAARAAGLAFTSATCDGGATPTLHRLGLAAGEDATSAEPLGVVTYNDVLAVDVYTGLLGVGRRPGSDVAMVSYDNSSLAARAELAVTSVDQDPALLGQEAVAALLDHGHGRQVAVSASLVVRSSSLLPRSGQD